MARINWVGFDGDDTLWHSEFYYRAANEAFLNLTDTANIAAVRGRSLTDSDGY